MKYTVISLVGSVASEPRGNANAFVVWLAWRVGSELFRWGGGARVS